ncbi:alpha-amylase family glycosyl hydrolase [Duganella radicis]|uniref:Alpha-amylase n=1 Tax=Duganella radicis TaxID=551988 RepID=A0A6L6PGB8_9BURK|nr:alpha-amylase family glycosyl hydrolase [Duganella radicis]MTV37627.1 alpha-amylase [Duganella radicis]
MKKLAASLILATLFTAAHAEPKHPAWSRSSNVYEVNLRQYSKDGTLAAFTADLPRLKALGVDIIWLMPIHPIGQKNRKGTLGSYYAVQDYTAVNPEFGSIDDVRKLVKQARALGMHVILDWVGNHTAWDHPWATQHPDWYKKNDKGEIAAVSFKNGAGETEEWADVIGLDYGNKELWPAMISAMAFWVKDVGVDGFRADAAGFVPTEFWNQARAQLDKIKPVFMLAESDEVALHDKAFDASYDWTLNGIMKKIGKGQAGAADLRAYVSNPAKAFSRDSYRLQFTSNHDINSWEGTDKELYGPAWGAMAVLSYTLPGIPLVYNGQEAKLDKKLAFFEKDAIEWNNIDLELFFAGLNALKKQNPALWNGASGAPVQLLEVGNENLFAFKRQQGANNVRVIVNTTGQLQKYKLAGDEGQAYLKPWRWRIVVPE